MSTLKTKTILLVDDAPDFRLIARKILEGDGANVVDAESVDQALLLYERHSPHLVITDLNMPGKSGFELLTIARERKASMTAPIIVMSGLSDHQSIRRALSLGAADYLIKPCRAALMLQKVRKSLFHQTFRRRSFPENARPKIQFTAPGEILMASESGFLIESPVRLSADTSVQVQAALLESLGCQGARMKTASHAGRFSAESQYISEIHLIGIDRATAVRIRKNLGGRS